MAQQRNVIDVCTDISTMMEDYERDHKYIDVPIMKDLEIELCNLLIMSENNDNIIDGSFLELIFHLKESLDKDTIGWEYIPIYNNLFNSICEIYPCLAVRDINEIESVSYNQLKNIKKDSYIFTKKI